MQKVLKGQDDHSSPYIDDIVIFSGSWDDHVLHIEMVLDCLQRSGLTVKRSKCEWGKRSIEYLGYVVGHGQLSVPQARARAIEDFKRSNTIKQMLGPSGITNASFRTLLDILNV